RSSSFAIPGRIVSARPIGMPAGRPRLILTTSHAAAVAMKHEYLRHKRRVRLHRVHRAPTDGVAEVGEVGAGRARRIDADQFGGPGGEKAVLAMGRFLDDEVEAVRILAVGEEERSIVETDRATGGDDDVIGDLQYGRVAGVPLGAMRLVDEAA